MKSRDQKSNHYSTLLLIPITISLLIAYSIKASNKITPERIKFVSELTINDEDRILTTKSELSIF